LNRNAVVFRPTSWSEADELLTLTKEGFWKTEEWRSHPIWIDYLLKDPSRKGFPPQVKFSNNSVVEFTNNREMAYKKWFKNDRFNLQRGKNPGHKFLIVMVHQKWQLRSHKVLRLRPKLRPFVLCETPVSGLDRSADPGTGPDYRFS